MALRVIKNTLQETTPTYTGPHRQISLQHCWSQPLNNPWLNKLYKDSISYTERWYLETRRLITDGIWDHPLLNSVILDPNLKFNLIKSTIIDGAVMREVINNDELPQYQMSACVNLKKLTKWSAFFVSLPNSIETLLSLNDLTQD